MHRRTATIGTVLTLATTLAAVLLGATPAQATPTQSAVTTQAAAARTIDDHFTSKVQHTSVAKTGGQVRERLVIHLDDRAMVENLRVYQLPGTAGHLRQVRGPIKLGWLSAGEHSWTWTGYDNRGKQVPDGYYEIHADITFPGVALQGVNGRAFVHRHYYPGYLTSQFPALYPRSRTIHDSTTLENTNARSRPG